MINELYENAVQNLQVADEIVSNATSLAESIGGSKISKDQSAALANLSMCALAYATQVYMLLQDIRDGKL